MKKLCIGIAGFGVVGKSYLRYLCQYGATIFAKRYKLDNEVALGEIVIWDEKEIADKESVLQAFPKVSVYDKHAISFETFLQICDYVLVSPGIAQSKESQDNVHVVSELDIFAYHNNKPTIAVTGSLGKTTITTLIYKLLKVVSVQRNLLHDKSNQVALRAVTGGNIGNPMLDLLSQQFDVAVLELSSFQLARNHSYRPSIAILNNIYPNHLDWHSSFDDYFGAKSNIWRYQLAADKLIISYTFFIHTEWASVVKPCKSDIYIVAPSLHALPKEVLTLDRYHVLYSEDNILWISLFESGNIINKHQIIDMAYLPTITFVENWIFVLGAVFLAGADMLQCAQKLQDYSFVSRLLDEQAHRLERCLTVADVDFYNDSKATIVEATQAAVERLSKNERPVIVILGGLDKGMDRGQFVQRLISSPAIKQVYYFGKQAELFVGCKTFTNLPEVIDDIFAIMTPGDQVLFSPSGTSFDFFANYQHRGNFFKELVQNKARILQ